MPLIKGASRPAVSANIKQEMSAGKPQNQAVAIAMDVARRVAHRKKFADGGEVDDSSAGIIPPKPWFPHVEFRPQMEDRTQGGTPVRQTAVDSLVQHVGRDLADMATTPGDVVAGKFQHAPKVKGQWSDEDEAMQQVYDRRLVDQGVGTALNMVGAPGLTGGMAGLGSGVARMRYNPLTDPEAMSLAKEKAVQKRGAGIPTGKDAAGWDFKRPDAEAGTWADSVARARTGMRNDISTARENYRTDTNQMMTQADWDEVGKRSFTLGSGTADKRAATALAAVNASKEARGADIFEAVASKYPDVTMHGSMPTKSSPYGVLSKIEVPKDQRGQGIATQVMGDLAAEADRRGIKLALSPTAEWGASKPRLEEFYKRFGFMPNTGRSKDFTTRETMVRDPAAQSTASVRNAKLPMDNESRLARAKEQGFEGPWYHGSGRIDRVTETGKLDPRRATSGPMPFFTDNPEIASNYAKGKADTSLARDHDMAGNQDFFTVSPKQLGISGRAPLTVEQSWHHLPAETKADITAKARRVGYDDLDNSEGAFRLHPEGVDGVRAGETFERSLRDNRGNPLAALRDVWVDSGRLFDSPDQLSEIYRLAGYPHAISESRAPWTEAKGVMPAMLNMRNPLKTDDAKVMTETVLPALELAFKRDRSRVKPSASDQWDKVGITPREWIAKAKEDYAKGDNSFVWTQIPDKVTAELRRLGYDGILDTGGKMGGQGHRVAVPFAPEQVRSTFAKFDPKNEGKSMLLGSGTGDRKAAAAITAANATRERAPAQGIRAYHGSPHDFDRFDMSKIGTGEGAQAFGHGLYFAENEAVARSYKAAGQPAYLGADRIDAAKKLMEQFGGDRVAAMNAADANMRATTKYGEGKLWQDVINNFDSLVGKGPGKMYEVGINAKPEHFLDWDAPLSRQPDDVRKALLRLHPNMGLGGNQPVGIFGAAPLKLRQNTERLLDSGVPGIKYLDQGSRGPPPGVIEAINTKQSLLSITKDPAMREKLASEIKDLRAQTQGGTSNFVVFDDKLVDIKRKYSMGGDVTDAAMKVARQIRRARGGGVTVGALVGTVAGRTDHRPIDVPAGAYVLPADHVSSLGEGNTLSGMAVLKEMFGAQEQPQARARGGALQGEDRPAVPIMAADGEYVISPDAIIAKYGNLEDGHAALDEWVKSNRKKHIKTLSKLPGPATS